VKRLAVVFIFLLTGPLGFGETNCAFQIFPNLNQMSREEARALGLRDASADFSNGVYRIETYGLRSSTPNAEENYLKEHYGIQIHPIAACVVSSGILGHADGYNSRMKDLLIQKFEHDVFKEARDAVTSASGD